jgi:predicted RecA/RadA family phage recombinase
MAKNIKRYLSDWPSMSLVCSHPATPVSGDPVRVGEMTGIALTNEGDGGNGATETTVLLGGFVAEFSVKGIDGSGNSAVGLGDKLYYTDADTPPISKKATGRFVGFANGTVGSSATATIEVIKPVNGA